MFCIKCTVLLLFCAGIYAYTPFILSDCSSNGNDVVTFSNIRFQQYPVTIPGHLAVSMNVHVFQPIIDYVRVDVTIEKYFLFEYFRIPCVSRIGSCAYDFCGLLDWFTDRGCPWQMLLSEMPCLCPIQNGTYTMQPYEFYIGSVHGLWQWIAFGDFRITGRFTDTRTNAELGCYTVEFMTQAEVVEDGGYFGLFGWK